ncbi:hypothetical protein ACY05_00320 [Sterolibacterium denitrificans]|uniref:AsmA domain-containing protein n=1 Tax=Sterolibacterium denitrificans TaxID=157592 RepID=A0A656Z7V9_9PROT|nr:hypothetical protein ACY05_00320 [Sterolibacterium denitrificans]
MLVVVWLLFAWQALPHILQSQAVRFVAEKTGHRLSLDLPEFNPFELRLRLANLRLDDPQGQPLLAFRGLEVDLSAASITRRALVFDGIRLDGPEATVALQADGKLNWSPFLDALKNPEETPDGDLPRIDVKRFVLAAGRLDFSDAQSGFSTRAEPLDFELGELSTLPDDQAPGHYKVEARTALGARVLWQGALTLQPDARIDAQGRLAIEELDLSRLAPYLQDLLPTPPAGVLAVATDYRAAYAAGQVDLQLEHLAAQLSGLRLKPMARGPEIVAQHIAAQNGRFDLASRRVTLDALTLDGGEVHLPAAAPLRIDNLTLSEAQVDLAGRRASLARVALQGGQVKLQRDARGRLDLLAAIAALQTAGSGGAAGKSSASSASSAPAAAPPEAGTATGEVAAPWQFDIAEVALAGVEAQFRDLGVKPVADLALQDISVNVSGVSSDLDRALPLNARLRVREGGQLEASGEVVPATAAAVLKFKLGGLALQPAQPWLNDVVKLRLASGRLDVDGEVSNAAGARGPSFKGGFALHDLRLMESEGGARFLAWKQLSTRDLKVSGERLDIGTLLLDGLDTKLIIAKDKRINVSQILKSSPPASAPEAGSGAAPPPAAAGKPFPVNLTRLRIRNGALDFADHSLALPFGTRIHRLQGSINGLTTRAGAPGRIELDGQVDEYGLARAVGQIDLAQPTENTDIKVIFRNVEMSSLTPYSATFAGRRIESGKLSLDLEYKIKQRQLLGDNQVVMDKLTLGERVDSPTAKSLPLDLAIAILQDGDGRIDLGLPVSGSLDDPQFSYGGIIWKAILNVFTKIATAPFRMLGSLLGGDGEKFESIAFEPGAQSLTPPEREKLAQLADALGKRPTLTLTLHGTYAETDRVALQDRQLRRAIMRLAGQQAAKDAGDSGSDPDPGPLTTGNPKIQDALEKLYAERFGSGELAALKEGFRKANPGALEESAGSRMLSRLGGLMREQRVLGEDEISRLKGGDFYDILFEQLRAREAVADERLLALARTRGEKALAALLAAGAPADRATLGAAEKIEAEGREIPLKLALAAQAAAATVPPVPAPAP